MRSDILKGSRFCEKSDVGRGRPAAQVGWRATAAFMISASVAWGADPSFAPIAIPEHVYDGGWEHFVGGGLAVLDCDGDARPDLVAAGGANPPILLRNISPPGGPLAFEDASPDAFEITATTGAYPLDLNNDAILDLVVLRLGPDMILKGRGDCTFDAAMITDRNAWTTAFSATWEVGQSDPTLAFGHYVDRANPDGPFEACDDNTLLRPGPEGYQATPLSPGHCALSILFTDWSRTGRADLRISNDRHYYIRNGQEQLWAMEDTPRRYTEADGWTRHMLWGMGIATRDIDRDGRDEVFLSSMGDQRLMQQTGDTPTYADVPFGLGTAAQRPYTGDDGRPSTGWHIAFGDVNNDGLEDVFIAKGNVQQMPGNAMEDPNNLLVGQENGSFVEKGGVAGIASFHRARGAALVDLNADGLLDLAVVNRRAPMEVWQNTSATSDNWISVDARQKGHNAHAVGAWIEVDDGTQIQSREITVGGGHAGGTSGPQHFGIGAAQSVRMRIRWPHESWSDWQTLTPNQVANVTRP